MNLQDVSKRTLMIANGAVGLSVILWLLLLAGIVYLLFSYIRGRLFPHQALASKDIELAARGGDADDGAWKEAPRLGLRLSEHGSGHGGSSHSTGGHGALRSV